ncbi:Tetratricopeptide repeat protein 12 [Schistosoma japonicum]|nr:Tetratricopeptide repeat protein 12 [Schistosoma japonicum]KAH8868031.1 Tetratricopeptide repeat protein 12 [Schistosoma japonicum]KAH8868032.1 Tetratricopeptide repeat protein 12 [Schistosoma japonicum]KAH8868033.1 Tetratricopeptide repeat protein 12 [Schistosoma japonicum]
MNMKESFEKLKEAEKVFELVQKLSSTDSEVVNLACKEADSFLKQKCRDGFDRSVLNKMDNPKISDANSKTDDVNTFMTAVAQDAQERAQRRAKQRERADKLKDRANAFFKAGNCKKAVELYSQAITVAKDYDILYTNRAQAYLRLGQPDLSLKDCDTALLLFPEAQNLNSDTKLTTNNHVSNPRLAKVHLHRGKALMSLNRPSEALSAYSLSRYYSASKSDQYTSTKINEEKWPNYLVEYVSQAEAAFLAQEADAKAEANFAESAIGFSSNMNNENSENISSGQQLLCLLAQLARKNQNSKYYSAGLRYLNRLFINAPKVKSTAIMELNNNGTTHISQFESSESLKHTSEMIKSNKKSKGVNQKPVSEHSDVVKGDNHSTETLSELQSIFRIKSGFSLLDKEVNAIYEIFNPDNICEKIIQSNDSCTMSNNDINEKDLGCKSLNYSVLDESERMLALLNLADHLTTNCAENQRLLIERQPNLIKIALACINLSPDFVQRITHSTSTSSKNLNVTIEKQRSYHILGSLRLAACNLLMNLTSLPSGRQSLLDMYGPGPILTSLASCLSASMPSRPVNAPTSPSTISPPTLADAARGLVARVSSSSGCASAGSLNAANNNLESAKAISLIPSAVASVCAAKAAQILEFLTESSRFLKTVLQSRKALLYGLADCLTHHVPLLNDTSLTEITTNNDCSTFCLTSNKLVNSILNGIGAILDQIGHGPELRAVVIALAGRLLPICHDIGQLSSWFGEQTTESIGDLPSRTRLLLAILDSCSLDSCSKRNLPFNTSSICNQPSSENVSQSNGTNNVSSHHLITGCIRCLASGTSHSVGLRYAIGDDRLRVRRLARLIRTRLCEGILQSRCKSSTSSLHPPSTPRDEPLAGNVCLILQHCASDTPLAEHLQGTSVIYDLLSLIQESQRLDTKRNAAILIGKLAQSSQVHRDELSRLDGYSVLTPFNSWTAALERY